MNNKAPIEHGRSYLAVYGTLRRGLGANELLRFSSRLFCTEIKGFRMLDLGAYPCVLKTDNDENRITVEVYSVTRNTLKEVDRYENCDPDGNGMFDREVITISNNGVDYVCWIYLVGPEGYSMIEWADEITSGDYWAFRLAEDLAHELDLNDWCKTEEESDQRIRDGAP